MRVRDDETGSVAVLLVGVLVALAIAAVLLGAVGSALAARDDAQAAADLGALAGARALREAYPRLFEPVDPSGRVPGMRLSRAAYDTLGRRAADETARRNGARAVRVELLGDGDGAPPVRVRVVVADPLRLGRVRLRSSRVAEAELVPDAAAAFGPVLSGNPGEHRGPFAMRQGKPMRPDVALAFDRMAAAARQDGIALLITSAFRSDAEQAALFAKNPDPTWVAPPGRSLHRLGTELDLGPNGAWPWLAANARRFGFLKRYSWEPWHFGYVRSAGSASVLPQLRRGRDGADRDDRRGAGGSLPPWVPDRFAPLIAKAAQRWNVSGVLLAAQLRQESGFRPDTRSPAGAQGIAQFMPGTARAYGLHDPFDPAQAIDAQAHLMHDLLRRFGSVPLALAAYNAGPGRVSACGCVPPIAETVAYVAAILGVADGAGDLLLGAGGLEVRLVR